MARALKQLLRPNMLIPLILIAATIVLLFSFGNPARILAIMESFNRVDLIWVFLLTVAYEGIRFVQWWYLLRHEGVRVPLDAQIFSFAGGEATRFMPIGNYFENYLLTAAEGVDFGFSSAVTTLTVLLEVAVCTTGLVILGLGSWWWIRPVIIIGSALAAGGVWLFYKIHRSLDAPAWIRRSKRARKVWENIMNELRQFASGVKILLDWRTLLVSYLFSAAYVIIGGGILYVVLAGLGWTSTPFGDVLAVYFFSLAFGLIFPLPIDFGVTELSGVGAFLVVGVERNVAISAMLINRLLTLGFSIIIGIIVSLIYRDEFRKAMHARGARRTGQLGFSKRGETENASQSNSFADHDTHAAPETPGRTGTNEDAATVETSPPGSRHEKLDNNDTTPATRSESDSTQAHHLLASGSRCKEPECRGQPQSQQNGEQDPASDGYRPSGEARRAHQ